MKRGYGRMLGDIRRSLGMDAADIMDGVCAKVAYSKYENGRQEPDIMTVVFLMQRMGVSVERFELVITDEEYAFYAWRCHCEKAIAEKDWEELRKLRDASEGLSGVNDRLKAQYRLFVEYVLYRREGKEEKAMQAIEASVRCTLPGFEEKIAEGLEWNRAII